MSIFDRFLVRRRALSRFSAVPVRVRRRLALARRELDDTEAEMAEQLGLSEPPRLLMVDEEEAVIVFPGDRAEIP